MIFPNLENRAFILVTHYMNGTLFIIFCTCADGELREKLTNNLPGPKDTES